MATGLKARDRKNAGNSEGQSVNDSRVDRHNAVDPNPQFFHSGALTSGHTSESISVDPQDIDVNVDSSNDWDKESSTRYQLATSYKDPPLTNDPENLDDNRPEDSISQTAPVKQKNKMSKQNVGWLV